MRNPLGIQTSTELKSESTYALLRTRRLHWDIMPFFPQCPRAATRAGSAWVSKAITLHRKNSKFWLKTPTLGKTPYLESLLFLVLPPKSDRKWPKTQSQNRQNFKSKIN
ncbi:unnamed protein product [Prunus armeniaca]